VDTVNTNIFSYLASFEDFIWSYFCLPAILLVGLYFTLKSRAVQLRRLPTVVKTFFGFLLNKSEEGCSRTGVHPIKTFFACIGGCVGIGNIVGITTAVQIGGPGAIFWMWIAAIIGSLVKYSEVFLGVNNRVKVGDGYRGGPMYVLRKAFGKKWIGALFCLLMCVYGVEVFQFSVVTSSVSANFGIAKPLVVIAFLGLIVFAEWGGVNRVGSICATIIPFFITCYIGMGLWIVFANITLLPHVFADIFHYAFTAHAATGAFCGSALILTMTQGIRRACYCCDIGVGYASIMHSESRVQSPSKQASLVIFDVFLDTFVICTMSSVIVLVTGTWTQDIDALFLVQNALAAYFPYMNIFIPLLLTLIGYSVIIAYFCAGMKAALFLSERHGRKLYYLYSGLILVLVSFVDTSVAYSVMSCVLALLLTLNLSGLFRLRREVDFGFGEREALPAFAE
jgi:AGCS family alanine or glycine:cation symporter